MEMPATPNGFRIKITDKVAYIDIDPGDGTKPFGFS